MRSGPSIWERYRSAPPSNAHSFKSEPACKVGTSSWLRAGSPCRTTAPWAGAALSARSQLRRRPSDPPLGVVNGRTGLQPRALPGPQQVAQFHLGRCPRGECWPTVRVRLTFVQGRASHGRRKGEQLSNPHGGAQVRVSLRRIHKSHWRLAGSRDLYSLPRAEVGPSITSDARGSRASNQSDFLTAVGHAGPPDYQFCG